jgi:ubiquinone/menaquinone biosynthesis C-methylase UbiE
MMKFVVGIVGGAIAFAGGVAATSMVVGGGGGGGGGRKSGGTSESDTTQVKSVDVYNRIAGEYDRMIWREEVPMGIPLFRWMLLRHARGDVLEVSAGTGRDCEYLPSAQSISSLTLIDKSEEMVKLLKKKSGETANIRDIPLSQ